MMKADKKQDTVTKWRRKHLSNVYIRQQRAAFESEWSPNYAPDILEEVDEEYVAQQKEWEEESEEEKLGGEIGGVSWISNFDNSKSYLYCQFLFFPDFYISNKSSFYALQYPWLLFWFRVKKIFDIKHEG